MKPITGKTNIKTEIPTKTTTPSSIETPHTTMAMLNIILKINPRPGLK
jgi:hypothetical protein